MGCKSQFLIDEDTEEFAGGGGFDVVAIDDDWRARSRGIAAWTNWVSCFVTGGTYKRSLVYFEFCTV